LAFQYDTVISGMNTLDPVMAVFLILSILLFIGSGYIEGRERRTGIALSILLIAIIIFFVSFLHFSGRGVL
jgi:uncharacterized membrane protein YGL010W